jgi:hypothetical protein
MTQIAEELDARLRMLAPAQAQHLEALVREAMLRSEPVASTITGNDWPPGYFERTAGALVGEEYERPLQGDLPIREDW